MLAFHLLGRLQRARDDSSVSDHGHVSSLADRLGLAERNGVIGPWIWRATKRLAIQPLVLQKQDWIIAAYCSSQQSIRIQRIRWEDHPQTRCMGEDALATLRVIYRAPGQISAYGNPNHCRR